MTRRTEGLAGRRSRGRIGALVALALVAACGTGEAVDDTPIVVASSTILGDVVANVVGDDGRVEVLAPIGADPHDLQISARQAALLAGADLVVWVGDSLEQGVAAAIEQAAADGAAVVELLPLVDPLPADDAHTDDAHTEGGVDEHGLDPHFWLDPLRMVTAVEAIGAALAEADPSVDWKERAASYAAEIEDVDAEVVDILAAVPRERRKLVTNHDSLSYFAERYGFDVVGTIIPGVSSLAETSSAEMAALAETITREGVPAVFAETTNPATLADALTAEVGGDVEVVTIHTGSLGGSGSGAETYLDLIRTNATAIAGALS